jgi:hypothetical protein
MILTLMPHTLLKLTAVFRAEKMGTDHDARRIYRETDVNS